MTRLALACVALALALPAAAQSLSTLLPQLTYPEPVVISPATKGCAASTAPATCPDNG